MGCFTQGNKIPENLLWKFDMKRVKTCPFGCSRLCKPALSWLNRGRLGLPLLLSHWKPQGEIFFSPGLSFPSPVEVMVRYEWRAILSFCDHGTGAETCLVCREQPGWVTWNSVVWWMWNQPVTFQLLEFGGFCWNLKCENGKRKWQNKFGVLHFATS